MADDGSQQSQTEWPLTKFRFRVTWDSTDMLFQEVSGLDVEAQAIEYRAGHSKQFAPLKMPGLRKFSDVTLRKGIFMDDRERFFDWFSQIKLNTIKKQPITISLLDEAGAATMVWKLTNAWPTKVTGTDLKASGNDVAVETIVIAHEGLSVENA